MIEKFTVNLLEPISVSNLSHGQYIVVFKTKWKTGKFEIFKIVKGDEKNKRQVFIISPPFIILPNQCDYTV